MCEKNITFILLNHKSPLMKEKEIKLIYTEYNDMAEMSEEDRMLIGKAIEAGRKAYAPYSRFQVGAAMLLEDGTVVSGANVENAAFPSGSCAEKTALSYAVSNYPDLKPVAIAVVARNENGLTGEPVPPCGNCRQMLLEEENRNGKPIKVILYGSGRIVVVPSSEKLMPLQFNRDHLIG
jgi:cytidine deaminase